jgi:hypothetical protein
MRKTALLLVIAVYGYAANAQFSLRPQIGIESPVTKITYNNQTSVKQQCQTGTQIGLRADYQFKSGFGPFLGLFSHGPMVSYNFNDPETGMTDYKTSTGDTKLQILGGMQYSSKPFVLSNKTNSTKSNQESKPETNSICSHYSPCCSHRKSMEAQKSAPQNVTWTVKLQPSVGIAYMPSSKPDLETKTIDNQTSYTYNAGNVKTEFVTGMGFEFAVNKKKILAFSINYFKGLGNNETKLTTETAGKTLTTYLSSNVSGWNASFGIPISFTKSKTSAVKTSNPKLDKPYHHSCGGYYHHRCGNYIKI